MTSGDTAACLEVLREASQHVMGFLGTSQGLQQVLLEENQFHTGDDPITADLDTHVEFESFARRHPFWGRLKVWNVVGEERIIEQPPRFTQGHRVIVVDPLDGSTAWAMARQAYCVAAMSLLAGYDGRLTFECAVIVTPVHTFTYTTDGAFRFGPTTGAPIFDSLIQSVVPESSVRPRSVAMNGYKKRDRRLVLDIMRRLSDWDVLTMGGNPFTPYVAIGNLTAVVNTRSQCTWDALGILMCTATDAVIGAVDGTLLQGPGFRTLFDRVMLSGNVKLIPPMVVAKNLESFERVASATQAGLDNTLLPDIDDL